MSSLKNWHKQIPYCHRGIQTYFQKFQIDIIFQNDLEKWRRFGNSLHLRLAMRLSEVTAITAATEAANAIDAGVMESSSTMLNYQLQGGGSGLQLYVPDILGCH